LYGNGVHSYFGGDYSRAFESLSSVIRGGAHDPRAYYFRALTEMRLGREQDATADLQKGAALEAADVNGRYSVSQALERIQGSTRAALEKYRENARAVAMQRNAQQRQNVYGRQNAKQATLLRHDLPPAELAPAPIPDQVAKQATSDAKGPARGADTSDPFKTTPAKPDEGMPDKTAVQKPGDATDPFGADAAKKPGDDSATKPAAAQGAKAADVGDPFGTDTKPGDAAKPADKATEKPADKAADGGDPFGADAKPDAKPTDKAASPPAEKQPDAAAATDASKTAVKPQPGAVRGIFKALTGAVGGDGSAAPPDAAKLPPANAKPAAPPAGAGAADPFGAVPETAAKPAAPKAGDPFADESASTKTAPDAKVAPDLKGPAPADKGAPAMKKDDDPFKI
jgi:hypothetical protein